MVVGVAAVVDDDIDCVRVPEGEALEMSVEESGQDEINTLSSSRPLVFAFESELSGEMFVSLRVCVPLDKPLV